MSSALEFQATVEELDATEARALFDEVVREEMNMSSAEFLRLYDEGRFNVDPDSVKGLSAVLTVLSFAA